MQNFKKIKFVLRVIINVRPHVGNVGFVHTTNVYIQKILFHQGQLIENKYMFFKLIYTIAFLHVL